MRALNPKILIPLVFALTFGAYATTEWGNLFIKGNLSVTGTSALTGTTTIGGVTALSQTNSVTGITNKTFTAPILDIGVFDDQSSTPSNPSSGYYKFYFKTDGKAYALDSSGTETEIGSGAAGTNDQTEYITNGKFEAATTGWSTYADAAATTPADGTGGSPNITFSRTTTAGEILKGTASGEIVKTAVNRQGEGISYDFTVDPENYSNLRPVYISFDYKTTANYASSDITVSVYDKDAAALLTVQDADNLSGALPASTTGRRFTGVFYPTTSTSNDYRLIFHIGSTNASAYDVQIDSVHAGSSPFVPGSVITDWTTYTPSWTSSGTQPSIGNGTLTGRWRRVGDSMEVEIYHLVGSSTSNGTGNYYWSLPTGYTMDTAKLPSTSAQRYNFGPAIIHDTGAAIYHATVGYLNTSAIQVFFWGSASTYVSTGTVYAASAPAAPATGDEVFIQFKVPISGWSSGASISSNEIIQSTVKIQATGDAASASSGNPIIFPSETYDTMGAYSTSTGLFTVPQNGDYRVHGFIVSANTGIQVNTYVNSSPYLTLGQTDSNGEGAFTGTVRASKGDTISLRPNGTLDVGSGSALHIERMADFSTFSQYNTVDRQYTCTLSGPAGWSTTYCIIVPYLTADGTWRARFNFQGTYTSAASASITITGVTFSSLGRQAISCNDNSGGSAPANNFIDSGASAFSVDFASNNSGVTCSGDVALASKPTMVP